MKIEIHWKHASKLPKLDDAGIKAYVEAVDAEPGLYIFARVYGGKVHPLYVGQATNLKSRVKQQFES